MKKITLLLFFVVGFWSVNAQNQSVKPVTHRYDNLRSPKAIIVLEEDFNGAALPAGWTDNNNSTPAYDWRFSIHSGYNGGIFNGTPYASIACLNHSADAELISPVVDVSTLDNVYLSFDQIFKKWDASTIAHVDVFDGTDWVNVLSNDTNVGVLEKHPIHQSIDVTAYKNDSFQVRFYFRSNHGAWGIDNVMIFERGTNDLAAVNIFSPEFVASNVPVALKTTIFNIGLALQDTFDVTFDVKDSSNTSVFNETVNVTGAALSPNSTYEVVPTTQLSLPIGTYTVKATVALVSDENVANDTTLSKTFTVIDLINTHSLDVVYGNVGGANSAADIFRTETFGIDDAVITKLGTADIPAPFHSGTFANNILIGVPYTHFYLLASTIIKRSWLYYIDGTTGTAYKYGVFSGDINDDDYYITGIAYNNDLNIGYVCTLTKLYKFDQYLNTTLVGSTGISYMQGLAIDTDGTLYSFDDTNDNLYNINPTTGASTLIGSLGIDIYTTLQDIDIDPATGNLYGLFILEDDWINNTNGSGLYSIDKTTGSATLIGDIKPDVFGLCAIKGTTVSVSENHIAGLKVYPNPTNGMITVNAQENIQNIAIVNLAGQVVKTFDNNGLTAQLDVSDLAAGNYILKITTDKTVGSYQIIKK